MRCHSKQNKISPREQDRATLNDLSQNHVVMFRICGILCDICPKAEERLQQQNRVYNTTECVVRDVWVEIEETVEQRTSRIQQTECAFCKVRAEAEEIAEQRSYKAKYRNQTAEFRWVLLTLIEDHDIDSRVAQQFCHLCVMGHIASYTGCPRS
jgi:hypothetical protein